MSVDRGEIVYLVLSHDVSQVGEGLGILEATEVPEVVVTRQSVVPAPLEVDGDQVEPHLPVLPVQEQLLADAGGEVTAGLVGCGVAEAGETHDALERVVDEGGVEEQGLEREGRDGLSGAGPVSQVQLLGDHAVPEPEGRGREGVGDGGVKRGVVPVSAEDLRHGGGSEDEREVLGVRDVLELGHENGASSLEELLVPPVGVDVGQQGG